jgi:hypothetical protein
MTMFRVHANGKTYDVIAKDANEARQIAIKAGAGKIDKIKVKRD